MERIKTLNRFLSGGALADSLMQASLHNATATEFQMHKCFLAGAFAIAFAGAAFAQTTTTEYYVVHDATTKKCTVVDKKPTSTTTTVVDNGVFKTKTEAETGMKSIKVCTNN